MVDVEQLTHQLALAASETDVLKSELHRLVEEGAAHAERNDELEKQCDELRMIGQELEQEAKSRAAQHEKERKQLDDIIALKGQECLDLRKQLQLQFQAGEAAEAELSRKLQVMEKHARRWRDKANALDTRGELGIPASDEVSAENALLHAENHILRVLSGTEHLDLLEAIPQALANKMRSWQQHAGLGQGRLDRYRHGARQLSGIQAELLHQVQWYKKEMKKSQALNKVYRQRLRHMGVLGVQRGKGWAEREELFTFGAPAAAAAAAAAAPPPPPGPPPASTAAAPASGDGSTSSNPNNITMDDVVRAGEEQQRARGRTAAAAVSTSVDWSGENAGADAAGITTATEAVQMFKLIRQKLGSDHSEDGEGNGEGEERPDTAESTAAAGAGGVDVSTLGELADSMAASKRGKAPTSSALVAASQVSAAEIQAEAEEASAFFGYGVNTSSSHSVTVQSPFAASQLSPCTATVAATSGAGADAGTRRLFATAATSALAATSTQTQSRSKKTSKAGAGIRAGRPLLRSQRSSGSVGSSSDDDHRKGYCINEVAAKYTPRSWKDGQRSTLSTKESTDDRARKLNARHRSMTYGNSASAALR